MTWEEFAVTGAVEDYLRYKGIDWKTTDSVRASTKEHRPKVQEQNVRETMHGTVDYSIRHGTGGLSVR